MTKTVVADEYKSLLKKNIEALREYIALLDRNHASHGGCMTKEALSVTGRLIEVRGALLTVEQGLKEKYDKDRMDLAVALANALAVYRKNGLIGPLVELATFFETCKSRDDQFPPRFIAGRN